MEIYRSIDELKNLNRSVVTLGGFDGLHTGHKKIIEHLKTSAEQTDSDTLLITFHPHPRIVLSPHVKDFKLLTTLNEKITLLNSFGIGHLLVLSFTRDLALLSAYDFTKNYLVDQIHASKLVIGFDHHFGFGREGNYLLLEKYGKEFGFEVEEIPAELQDNSKISSSIIRSSLLEGDMSKANHFLGYPYSITGKVIHGNKIGETIGYPTINLQLEDEYKLIPANGVYAVLIELDHIIYKGMTNIGVRPTFDLTEQTIETHIFNFNSDIYDQTVNISFIEKIRDEIKFESIELLKQQLNSDKQSVLEILN